MWTLLGSIAWYAACAVAVNALYAPVEALLESRYPESFRALSENSRAYCAKNCIKATVLGLALPATIYVVGNWMLRGEMRYPEFARAVGTLYASTDVVALYRVKLPANTRVHHVCVAVMSVCNLGLDYQGDSIFTNLVVLCGLSMVPFSVNAYLGLRKVTNADVLALTGLITYVPAFCLNVAWQISAILRAPVAAEALCWALLCGMIFFDDIVLMDHLLATAKRAPIVSDVIGRITSSQSSPALTRED